MRTLRRLILALLLPLAALAHGISASHTTLIVANDALQIALQFDGADLHEHFRLDRNHDGQFDAAELETGYVWLAQYLPTQWQIAINGAPVAWTQATATQPNGAAYVLRGTIPFAAPLQSLDIAVDPHLLMQLGATHINVVTLRDGAALQTSELSLSHPRAHFDRTTHWTNTARRFVALGIEHIFLGYDHIAFLLALVLASRSLWALCGIVTAFTLAHSVTLTLATLQLVALPPTAIEIAIAASIIYVGVENLLRPAPAHRWRLTFAFGLIHGFGFANVLAKLDLPAGQHAVALGSFNVGVELGQLAIVATCLPLTWALNRSPYKRPVVRAASIVIALLGAGWLVERLLGVGFMPF